MANAWRVEERVGDAASLHAGWPSVDADPTAGRCPCAAVTGPAVVLGSTQPASVVDADRAAAARGRGGPAAIRRGGGAGDPGGPGVDRRLAPGRRPAVARRCRPGLRLAGGRLGRGPRPRSGCPGLAAHRDGYRGLHPWSALVCFGGVGSGEVVTADGRKVVGLAQRRSRHGAWFHGACVLRWDPGPLVELLALSAPERAARRRRAGRGGGRVVADLADRARRLAGTPDAGTIAGVARRLPALSTARSVDR